MRRLLALLLLLLAAPLAAQEFPALSGRVVDAANILPPEIEAQISARSEAIEKQTGAQLVVATVPSLDGYEIEDYGYRLGRHWGIGQKRRSAADGTPGGDNGVILLVAPNERRVRIEVGYGLEPILTDALSSVIIQRAIIPEFKAGNMPAGVLAGFDSIAKQVELPADQAAQNVANAEQQAAAGGDQGFPIGLVIFLIILFIWFVMASRRTKGGRKARRGGPIVIWGPGGGWGGGGGGWGGGGGFGGGGGGFGGGGASGGW
ncbi:MAG: methanol dehydrogenase [Sphingomonas sp.]|nr:MAG: methanol dehydrogenase [Sphingomonas sp.]